MLDGSDIVLGKQVVAILVYPITANEVLETERCSEPAVAIILVRVGDDLEKDEGEARKLLLSCLEVGLS